MPTPTVQELRMIFPQPAFISIVDILMAVYIDEATRRRWPDPEGVFTAAKPGTQILDITHVMALLLERGADAVGNSAAAVAGIKEFYDNIDIAKAIEAVDLQHDTIAQAIVRHQLWVRVGVKCGASTVQIRPSGWGN